jgi:hypothetical protein
MVVITATYRVAFPTFIESIDQRHFRLVAAASMLGLEPIAGGRSMPNADTNIASLATATLIVTKRCPRFNLLHDLYADWRRWTKAERVCAGMAAIVAASALLSTIVASIGSVS